LKSFLAVSKQFTNLINTSFSQDVSKSGWHWHFGNGIFNTVCCLFIYLFIYLL